MKRVREIRIWPAAASLLAAIGLLFCLPGGAAACPFCSAVSLTLSEEIAANDVAVVARLIELPAHNDPADPSGSTARFEIVDVLKGGDLLGTAKQMDVLYFGQEKKGTLFYIVGTEPPNFNWTTPVRLSERAVKYIRKLPELPEKGADRLAFFQEYFEDAEEMLARDAYDEFAKAPYSEVRELGGRMHHDRLIRFINDRDVPASRRRLYLTMLGVCGGADDLAMLEEMIHSEDRETKSALDAMIACYLTLNGPDGLPLIEELFLKNQDAEYTDTYAAIMALRFHGQESEIIPRERLTESMRYMLDRAELADLVIPDLARWEDWSVMDRLVDLFKNSDEQSSWVRVPVINYLRACPDPKAKEQLEELAKLDPESMKRASSFFPFAAAPPPEEKITRSEEPSGEPLADTSSGDDADVPVATQAAAATEPPASGDVAADDAVVLAPSGDVASSDSQPQSGAQATAVVTSGLWTFSWAGILLAAGVVMLAVAVLVAVAVLAVAGAVRAKS